MNIRAQESPRSVTKPSGCSAIVLCLCSATLAPPTLLAQVRPDAGQTLETVRPAPTLPAQDSTAALPAEEARPALSAPEGQRVEVKSWRISGAQAFSAVELQALVNPARGQLLTLSELNAMADRITAYYRRHGYLLSRAYLPAQKINNGEVEIAVLEGHLGAIELDNISTVRRSVVREHVDDLKVGGAVQGQALERSLLLLNDLPGIEVRSTLRPGASVGTSDLDLKIRTTARFDGSIDADNYGSRYTGELRAGGTLNWNSPFGGGDQFTLRALTAGSGMTYGRASWQTPLGGGGWKGGIAWSDLRYELGENFEALDADGDARVGTLWAAYPFWRSQRSNLTGRISYDTKHLEDRIDVTDTNTRKEIDVITVSLNGDRNDTLGGGGVTAYGVELVGGRLKLDSATAVLDRGAGGQDTAGNYGKLALNLSRLQRLGDSLTLYTALSGQLSNKNLDSSEKQALGGSYGVRAYPQGEAPGDHAALLNLELRWQIPHLPNAQALLFADAATVKLHESPNATDGDNTRTLTGEGIGAQWAWPGSFAIKGYVAWRSSAEPTADKDRQPRYWLQMAQYF